jgi:hypothetical protein
MSKYRRIAPLRTVAPEEAFNPSSQLSSRSYIVDARFLFIGLGTDQYDYWHFQIIYTNFDLPALQLGRWI